MTYLLLTVAIADVNIECAFNGDIEGVSTPFTLVHDLFAHVVGKQPDVRSNLFAVAVVTTLHDHFEIARILLLAILFFEEFSSESEILDGLNNATPVGDFARHAVVYTTYCAKDK